MATDWIEDILLRTAPPEIYAQWFNHEIPFNDPEVLEAAEYMHQIWFTDDYAYGGTDLHQRHLHRQRPGPDVRPGRPPVLDAEAGSLDPRLLGREQGHSGDPAEWPNQPGEDVGFFYFPPIEEEFGSPVLGAGDMFVMFDDRPEVRASARVPGHTRGSRAPGIERGGFLAANKNVPVDWYTTIRTNELAAMVAEASTFGFDASDLMPAEVGAGTFWSGMVEWVAARR